MSTYIFMKILESAPLRYDRGIRLLTLGRLDKVYDRLASHLKEGWNVLDIGCGTGALTIRAAQRGAYVKGIDINPMMLEIARGKIHDAGLDEYVTLSEKGVAELSDEPAESYDAVLSGLCFSELTDEELTFTLKEAKRLLKSGGILLVADETVPRGRLKRILNQMVRLPLMVITYALTQTSTRAVKNLADRIRGSGFIIESCRLNVMEDFIEIKAVKPGDQNI